MARQMAATRKGTTAESKDEEYRCGGCKKLVGRSEKGIKCEICETWFHCKCEDMDAETYKLLDQDKIHFYCTVCDRVAGKLLKMMSELSKRQDKMEGRINVLEAEMNKITNKGFVSQEEMSNEIRKVRDEVDQVKIINEDRATHVVRENADVQKLQNDMEAMKKEIENKMSNTTRVMKEDLDEKMEIERRKLNIIIHGVPESDAEQDVGWIDQLFTEGLHLDFQRHVGKSMRVGRLTEKPRPIRVQIKTPEGRQEIFVRAKELKYQEKYKRIFISPDLTRKQQEIDKELRDNLKRFRESGEVGVKIRAGKVVKNVGGGRELVLYVPEMRGQ